MGDLKDNNYSPRHQKQKYICYSDTLAVRYGDTMNGYINSQAWLIKFPCMIFNILTTAPPKPLTYTQPACYR